MPCIRARGGIAVFAEKENVALGAYTSSRPPRALSNAGKKRMKKLLTNEPSTPAMKDGSIFHANVDNIVRGWEGAAVDVVGASNPTRATGSPSSISNDGKRRETSLLGVQRRHDMRMTIDVPLVRLSTVVLVFQLAERVTLQD